jgi:hypothetical protein
MDKGRFPGQVIVFLIGILGWVLLITGPLLAYLRTVEPTKGFLIFGLSTVAGVLALIAGITAMAFQRLKVGAALIVLGGLPIVVVVAAFLQGNQYPVINEVSTHLENPPQFRETSSIPDEFKPVIEEAYAELQGGLQIEASPIKVFQEALILAQEKEGWVLVHEDLDELSFEATQESDIFRFQEKFVVRVSAQGDLARVDMRSRSLNMQADFGSNAKRIEAYLSELRTRL